MPRRDYDDFDARRQPNAIERDRMERRRQLRRKSMMTNLFVVLIALAVIAGIIIAVVAMTGNRNNDQTGSEPDVVTATIAAEVQQTETTPPATVPQDNIYDNQDEDDSSQDDEYTEETYDTTPTTAIETTAIEEEPTYDSDNSASVLNGPLYYSASGQTSYGYDWTYAGGGGVVDVSCDYDFDTKQYNFAITGVSEGVATITLYYNTDDNVQQSVNMTVEVDSDLNVIQIG